MSKPSNQALGALMLALALLLAGQARAGPTEWEAHMEAGKSAVTAGDYRAGKARFDSALREANALDANGPDRKSVV